MMPKYFRYKPYQIRDAVRLKAIKKGDTRTLQKLKRIMLG